VAAVIRLGLAGVGAGARGVVEMLPKVPGYRVTAAADVRTQPLEDLRAQYPDIETYDSVELMCRSSNVDAVYIGSPNQFHTEHALHAASNGKHIFCEKIMALTLEDGLRMVEAAEANGLKFLAVHRASSYPPISHMARIAASGQLGKVIQVTTLRYAPWLLRPRLPEELDTRFGGGLAYRQAPYQVDLARLITGGIVRGVRATAGRYDPKNPTEGNYNVFLDFEDGATANLVYNGYGYFDSAELTSVFGDWTLAGDQGGPGQRLRKALSEGASKDDSRSGLSLDIERGVEPGGRPRDGQPFFGITIVSCERGDMRQTARGVMIYDENGAREEESPPWEGFLKAELEEFYGAVTEGKPITHDGRWGLANVEVCLAILESTRERREIFPHHQIPSPFYTGAAEIAMSR
jgi:phthalate 4,5-cis-dihydrodiol dehydrogenase